MYSNFKMKPNSACKDSFGAGPRLPMLGWGKTKWRNCSRLNSVGMPCHCSRFVILAPKKKGTVDRLRREHQNQQSQDLAGQSDQPENPQPVVFYAAMLFSAMFAELVGGVLTDYL